MASLPTYSADDSSDEEVFFGPMTDKESKLARRLRKRRTELYVPASNASRSLTEFRLAYNYLDINDGSLSKSGEGFSDSLEDENNHNDSGFDNKPCTVIDAEDSIPDEQVVLKDSICTASTTYYSTASEVDHRVTCLEDSLNNPEQISSTFASYYSTSSNVIQLTSYLEDSLNDESQLSSANAKRCSSISLRDRAIVYESSFEQDSYSEPENELVVQMEALDLKENCNAALSMDSQENYSNCNFHPDNSPRSVGVDKRNFPGIDEHQENLVEKDSGFNALATSPNSAGEQRDTLSNEISLILPAPPTSPEKSTESILSEENELTPERKSTSSENSLILPAAPASSEEDIAENKQTEELVPSCIPMTNLSAPRKPCEENLAAPEQLAPTNADGFFAHAYLVDSMIPIKIDDCMSANLENHALHVPEIKAEYLPMQMPLKTDCCTVNDVMTSCFQSDSLHENLCKLDVAGENQFVRDAPDWNISNKDKSNTTDDICDPAEVLRKITMISPKTANCDVKAEPSCTMVNHATSYNQSEEFEIDAKDQGCQTSFVINAGKDSVTEEIRISYGVRSAFENPMCGTLSSNQKQRRIDLHKAAIGPPQRVPIFKTPTKPALRVPVTCSTSASKSINTPKASPKKFARSLTPTPKSRFDHITSPIAKYINDSAVPSLVSNSKPVVLNSKLRTTPNTKIPVPTSSTKKPPLIRITPASKGILVPSRKTSKTQPPVAKAKNCLNFDCKADEDVKENSSIEDSILEELKISIAELKEINDKKLKKDVLDYVKTRKAMIVNAAKKSSGGNQNEAGIPYFNYKGASSLAMKQVDLVTKIHTVNNKNVVCSPVQPLILKHTGERKVIHWSDCLVSEVATLSSPNHPKIIAPNIFMKTTHKKSSGSIDSDVSTIDVSIVEPVNLARTNTLFKK